MSVKTKKIKDQKTSIRWLSYLGVTLVVVAVAFFVFYTRSLSIAILGWMNSEINGAIFAQAIWATFSVYTEILLETLTITIGIKLIRHKQITRWMLVCFCILLILLIVGHVIYQLGA